MQSGLILVANQRSEHVLHLVASFLAFPPCFIRFYLFCKIPLSYSVSYSGLLFHKQNNRFIDFGQNVHSGIFLNYILIPE